MCLLSICDKNVCILCLSGSAVHTRACHRTSYSRTACSYQFYQLWHWFQHGMWQRGSVACARTCIPFTTTWVVHHMPSIGEMAVSQALDALAKLETRNSMYRGSEKRTSSLEGGASSLWRSDGALKKYLVFQCVCMCVLFSGLLVLCVFVHIWLWTYVHESLCVNYVYLCLICIMHAVQVCSFMLCVGMCLSYVCV